MSNHTLTAQSRCGIHNTPTGEHARCSQCDQILPYWAELIELPTLAEAWSFDLRIDTGLARLWTSRTGRTVCVGRLDLEGHWVHVGDYDGNQPPERLNGVAWFAVSDHLGRRS